MRTLSVVTFLVLATLGHAADDLTVLKPDANAVPPRKMLATFLKAECQKQFDARKKIVAALATPADVQKRQQELREKFIAALGGFPEKTPLNAQVVGTIEGKGFRIEKVIFESRPQHHVTANLYLPPGKGPFPGVLIPCGHGNDGKASGTYQRIGMLLATNGIAALCYDPIGQGERMQILNEMHKPIISGTTEHTMLDVGALLVGRCTASYRIWDGIRALDYLASRPEVDPKRLGCTGVSGGGTLTSYLMALDDRIVCAAPSCYITSLERLFATIGPQDGEQNIPGQVAFGMDHADYLTMRAPRPTLVLCGTRDFFDIQGTWASFREAKQVYGILGHSERMDVAEFNQQHGYPKPQREAMVNWMRRWLLDKHDMVTEPEFTVYKQAELQCTRTGQVLEDFKGKSVVGLNVERERELTATRTKAWNAMSKEQQQKAVRTLLNLPEKVSAAKRKVVEEIKRDKVLIEKVTYETAPGILVPSIEYRPITKNPVQVYLAVTDMGKEIIPDVTKGGIEAIVTERQIGYILLDLRGFGETSPGKQIPGKPGQFGVDFTEAFLAMHLNRPLLGQRTYDLIAISATLLERRESIQTIVGIGHAAPVALHAALLIPDVKIVAAHSMLLSWSSVVNTPVSVNQLTNIVPGVLAVYDLPDLARALKPTIVAVVDAVDAKGNPVPAAVRDEAYPFHSK